MSHDDISKAAWRKASFCNGATACVLVAPLPDGRVGVRDSKDTDGPSLAVPAEDWQHFVEGIAYQLRADVGVLTLARAGNDRWEMCLEGSPEVLAFSDLEIAVFVEGVKDGEFDLTALTVSAGDGWGVDSRSEGATGAVAASGAGFE